MRIESININTSNINSNIKNKKDVEKSKNSDIEFKQNNEVINSKTYNISLEESNKILDDVKKGLLNFTNNINEIISNIKNENVITLLQGE